MPFDKAALFASVEKTSRALDCARGREDAWPRRGALGRLTEERFESLDAPVMRLTYPDTHPPFSQVLESSNLPDADKIADALRRLAAY